jgi:hypothetical protein
MPTELDAGGRDDVADRLVADFAGSVPPVVVRTVVEDAKAELSGQVPAGGLQEMLHHLAGQRLRERTGAPR